MRFFILIGAFVAFLFVCIMNMPQSRQWSEVNTKPQTQTEPYDPGYGGIGMTYGGKLGVEISPGLVLDFDGNLSFGYGF